MPRPVQPAFQVRRATVEDVGILLDLHYRVFDKATNQLLLLGRRFATCALRWYCRGPAAFALLAEGPTAPLGYITVNQGSYYSLYRANWPQLLRAFLSNPGLVVKREVRHRLVSVLRRRGQKPAAIPKNRACLAYVAVEASRRVKGVGSALVLAALRECHTRGWQEVITSFRPNNIPIRYLLAGLGFKNCPELDADGLVAVRIDTASRRYPMPSAGTGAA